MRPVVTYELGGDLSFVLDTALEEFAARVRDDPNCAPEWSERMARLADEGRRQASEAFDRPEPARPTGAVRGYQMLTAVADPGGITEIGYNGDVVEIRPGGKRVIALDAAKREEFMRAFMEAERRAEAAGKGLEDV